MYVYMYASNIHTRMHTYIQAQAKRNTASEIPHGRRSTGDTTALLDSTTYKYAALVRVNGRNVKFERAVSRMDEWTMIIPNKCQQMKE